MRQRANRLAALGWVGLLGLATALRADDQGFTIFPREYARPGDGGKTVGEFGRLVLVEDEEGEELEVVEFAVPRARQRESDLLLFTTVLPRESAAATLPRPYTGWGNGAPRALTFAEPQTPDRTIYRAGSAAHDARIAGLYETAVLDALIAKIGWFAARAEPPSKEPARPLAAPLGRLLVEQNEYLKLRRHAVAVEGEALYLRALLLNLERLPALHTRVDQATAALAAVAGRQTTISNELTALEKKLAGCSEPRGDPDIRRRDLLRVEDYEARADARFEQQAAAAALARIMAIVSNAAVTFAGAAATAPSDEQVKEWQGQARARLMTVEERRHAQASVARIVVGAAREVTAALTAFAARADLDDAGRQTVKAWNEAQAAQPLEAQAAEVVAAWEQAVARLPTLPFGRYRVTLVSRLQGVPGCVGTPIVITAGGVERRFYSYQWPDPEGYHALAFDVDFAESPAHRLEFERPTPRGGWGLCRDLDHYNELRLKGWQFEDETTLGRLAEALFDPRARGTPQDVAIAHAQALYQTRGTFDVSVALAQARRNWVPRGMGLGAPDASLDALFLDSIRIERVPEPPLVLRQVLVQKNWIKPGWDNRFMAWIHNRTDSDQTGRLTARLAAGFDDAAVIHEREITVPARSYARVVVPWQSATNAAWFGREVTMELRCGEAVTRAADTFTVHPNCFPVYIAGGPQGYDVYRGPKSFNNNVETFGITPGDSVGVLQPDVIAPVPSGMSDGAICHIPHLRAGAQGNHALGIGYTHYLSPLCTGAESYRQYLRHPEWWPDRLTWTEQMNDNWTTTERLYRERYYAGESFDGISSNYPLLHLEQPINHGCRDLFERLVEDLVAYHDLVPWDGTRWDGGPLSVFSQDFLGRPLKDYRTGQPVATAAQCKQLGAELFAELKRRLRQRHPDWVYGNNGDSDGYGGTLITLEKDPPDVAAYPQFLEFMKDHGAYMDEGWMSAYLFGDARNKVERYLRIGFKESMIMKRHSGNLWTFSPERDGSPYFNVDYIYYTILPYLFGATYIGQISPTPWSEDGPAYFFTRFGDFFLDWRWQPYPQAADRVSVDAAGVWAAEFATWRQPAADRVQVVVPVINRHPRERFMETQNRFSELPVPIAEPIGIRVQAPPGFEGVTPAVWALTCEPRTTATRLTAAAETGATRFELPGVQLFTVAVLDYRRKP